MITIKILIAILAFGLIIAVHELGHFFVARLCGIKVTEFALGMGPDIFKKQGKETLYSLRILPIGGFCSLLGSDEASDDEDAFCKKPIYKRAATLVAGAVMNLLLGFILVLITVVASKNFASTTIASFSENALSASTGLQLEDKLVSINGKHIFTMTDFLYELRNDEDGRVAIEVVRDGKKTMLDDVCFELVRQEDAQKPTLILDLKVYGSRVNLLNVLPQSFKSTLSTVRLIWMSLIDIVTGKYGLNDMSGPVGIVTAIGEASKYGLSNVISLVSMLTLNVGIFNLLPLPALDGGRIIFLIIEAIRRKPIKPEHEGLVHFIGLAALLLLMVVITFNDIKNIAVNIL